MTITLEVQELESAIKAERVAYYSGRPLLVSDREYDLQVLRLSELAPDSPVLHTVGQAVEDFRSAVTLPVPMLSITNVFTEEDLRKWVNLLPPNTLLLVQPKVDGVAGCIFDESNKVVAATRGDGATGENVTLTALHIVEKATRIPSPVIGEFYTPTAVHSENEDLFSSPRSMTVGSLKNSAKGNSGLTGLSFIQHDGEEVPAFEQIPTKIVSSSYDFSVVWAVVTSVYDTPYPYAIDGVVIKVANKQIRDKLGVTSSAPKWARAFKRNLESCDTTLTGITWQVGRTGVVTPVARFQPVVLGGHEIKCATLHNISYVTRYAVGDIVSVGRAGGVIPEVIDCVSAEGGNPLEVPACCPECGEPLDVVQKADAPILMCNNSECMGVINARLLYEVRVLDLINRTSIYCPYRMTV